jgi:hypothetical protein
MWKCTLYTRGAGGAQNGPQSAPGKNIAPPGGGPGRRAGAQKRFRANVGLSKLNFTGYENFSAIPIFSKSRLT